MLEIKHSPFIRYVVTPVMLHRVVVGLPYLDEVGSAVFGVSRPPGRSARHLRGEHDGNGEYRGPLLAKAGGREPRRSGSGHRSGLGHPHKTIVRIEKRKIDAGSTMLAVPVALVLLGTVSLIAVCATGNGFVCGN